MGLRLPEIREIFCQVTIIKDTVIRIYCHSVFHQDLSEILLLNGLMYIFTVDSCYNIFYVSI